MIKINLKVKQKKTLHLKGFMVIEYSYCLIILPMYVFAFCFSFTRYTPDSICEMFTVADDSEEPEVIILPLESTSS
jgi:hypothetical protein